MDAEQVAEELYRLSPGQFTAARNSRAQAAKAAGDKETAARILALRKPTVLAWLVNMLVQEQPREIVAFLELGAELQEATATLSGPELRQLSAQRHRLVQSLARQARELGRKAGYRTTADVARGLEETLAAGLGDPAMAERLRTGRLTSGLTATGFPTVSADPVRDRPARPSATGTAAAKRSPGDASPEPSSATERRRQQELVRMRRDLREAEERAEQAEQKQAVTAEVFEESQRALAEAEMAVADLQAELELAEQTRDEVKRESERAHAADSQAAHEVEKAGRLVADLLTRMAR